MVRLRSSQVGLVGSVMNLVDGPINADTGFVDALLLFLFFEHADM
jgi:hypothetical protein